MNSYNNWNSKKLNEFSTSIVKEFEEGKIKFPIHLCGGNSQSNNLIRIFKKYKIKKTDYILCTWRNSFHWLLSGRSEEEIKTQIKTTGSMNVHDEYFITSAIVGGISPIAVGLGMALKRKRSKKRVFCFLGDAGASCGISIESMRYACANKLPVTFIIEDNNLSVYTNVQKSWGCEGCKNLNCHLAGNNIEYFKYKRKYKHHGIRLEREKGRGLF